MGAVFDKFLGKLRQGLSKKEINDLSSSFQKALEYITVDNALSETLTVSGGTHVTLSNGLDQLSLVASTASHDEWVCVFTTSNAPYDPVVSIPASFSVVGEPQFAAGKSYIISVRDNMLVAAEYTPGV